MSFLPIYSILNELPEVKAIFGNDLRVYEDVAPQDVSHPYMVYQEVAGPAVNHIDEPANFDHVMYQVMIYDSNPLKAHEARALLLKVLEQYSFILNARIGFFEAKTKLYVRGFDANWFLNR